MSKFKALLLIAVASISMTVSSAERGIQAERLRLHPTSLPTVGNDGDVRYDTVTEMLKLWTDTGGVWGDVDGPVGANTVLSNLTSPTAVNQDLIPSGTRDLGSTGLRWDNLYVKNTIFSNVAGTTLGTARFNLSAGAVSMPSGATVNSSMTVVTGDLSLGNLGFATVNSSIAGALPTGSIFIDTGNRTVAVADSGDFVVTIGTSAAGSRGQFKFLDGTEGTISDVWTSTGTGGEGSWATLPAGGANTTLSNLTSPTAINQTLFPSGTRDLGENANPWNELFTGDVSFRAGGVSRAKADSNVSSTVAGVAGVKGLVLLTFGNPNTAIDIGIVPKTGGLGGKVLIQGGDGANTFDGGEVRVHGGGGGVSSSEGGGVSIKSGDSQGSNDSKDITLEIGASPSGTRGDLIFLDGSEGTSGDVWTSTGVLGEGNWSTPATAVHALGGASHTADTLANLNTKVSDATLIDTGDSRLSDARTPTAHALGGAEHSADTLANLNSKVSDATLIDTGDSRLSDARTPTAHALGGAEHSADTLANLNTKVSDATLIDTGDSRLSDARTPTAHALGGAEHSADTLANLNTKVSDATLIDTGDSRLSDDRTADGLRTATTVVSISAATAPTSGQVLEASSSTLAAWATPPVASTFYTANGTAGTGRTVGITDSINFDSNTFVIDGTNNRVGIGTTAPTAKLDISEASGNFGGAMALSVAMSSVGFYYATSTSSQSCNTTCEAEDSNAGFGSGSGFCLSAWDSSASSGSCAQSSVDRKCLCAGAM